MGEELDSKASDRYKSTVVRWDGLITESERQITQTRHTGKKYEWVKRKRKKEHDVVSKKGVNEKAIYEVRLLTVNKEFVRTERYREIWWTEALK